MNNTKYIYNIKYINVSQYIIKFFDKRWNFFFLYKLTFQ